MVSDTIKHYPVLLDELISIITPQHGGTFIDCTLVRWLYQKILSFKNTSVIALDRDIETKKLLINFRRIIKIDFYLKIKNLVS